MVRHSNPIFTPVRVWAAQSKIPVGTTAHHKRTLCHHMPRRNFTKNNKCFFFFQKVAILELDALERCCLKTFSKQNRMELPLVVSTSSVSECPVLKKTCSAISLEKKHVRVAEAPVSHPPIPHHSAHAWGKHGSESVCRCVERVRCFHRTNHLISLTQWNGVDFLLKSWNYVSSQGNLCTESARPHKGQHW